MTENLPFVSVILVNWNGKRFIKKCLGTLLTQDYPNYEVLFVDNKSTDDSLDILRNDFFGDRRLKLLAMDENYGFSKGNNIGFAKAQGKYVIALNTDTEVQPNFIKELVRTAECDETVGSVSCKILLYDRTLWFGQYFTHRGFVVPFFTQNMQQANLSEAYERFSQNLANSGCAALYRKDMLQKIGGFDEDFWSDWEDYDLGYRINLAGFKSVYIPKYLCLHVGGGSFGYTPNRMARMYRNMLFTYFKNYEGKNLVIRFPLFWIFFLPVYHTGWLLSRFMFSFSDFDRKKSANYVVSIIWAYFGFLLDLKVFCRKRYAIAKLRKTSDKQIFKNTKTRSL
jgi:GT2 family glycosyltransferase